MNFRLRFTASLCLIMNTGGPKTTTTTTVTETHVQTNLRWDPSYVKTIPGMLKAGAVVRIIDNCFDREKNLFFDYHCIA